MTAGEIIFRHRQPAVVAAHLERPQGIELVAFGALVAIQQQGGRPVPFHLAAGVDGVLLARLVTGLIAVAVLHIGDRLVLLGNTGHHLLVELLAQRLDRCEHGLGVGILGLEIVQHLGLLPLVVTQPVVVVDARVPVFFQGMGVLGSHRGDNDRLGGSIACRHGGLFVGMGTGRSKQASQQQPPGKGEHVASFALSQGRPSRWCCTHPDGTPAGSGKSVPEKIKIGDQSAPCRPGLQGLPGHSPPNRRKRAAISRWRPSSLTVGDTGSLRCASHDGSVSAHGQHPSAGVARPDFGRALVTDAQHLIGLTRNIHARRTLGHPRNGQTADRRFFL